MEEPTRLELVNSRFAIYGLTNLAMAPFIYLIYGWYPEPDLNRHGRNDRGILSPLCLPFHHPGLKNRYHIYLNVMFFMERANGFEPSTPTLARLCSTAELRPQIHTAY